MWPSYWKVWRPLLLTQGRVCITRQQLSSTWGIHCMCGTPTGEFWPQENFPAGYAPACLMGQLGPAPVISLAQVYVDPWKWIITRNGLRIQQVPPLLLNPQPCWANPPFFLPHLLPVPPTCLPFSALVCGLMCGSRHPQFLVSWTQLLPHLMVTDHTLWCCHICESQNSCYAAGMHVSGAELMGCRFMVQNRILEPKTHEYYRLICL